MISKEEDLLVCTMEECGELIQECSKLIRKGLPPQSTKELTDEVGDVLCLIRYLEDYGLINKYAIEDRIEVKRQKLKKWSSFA